jgi:hypothetical protein
LFATENGLIRHSIAWIVNAKQTPGRLRQWAGTACSLTDISLANSAASDIVKNEIPPDAVVTDKF